MFAVAPQNNVVPKGTNTKTKPSLKGLGFVFGADYEARTRYLHLGKVALYQMS